MRFAVRVPAPKVASGVLTKVSSLLLIGVAFAGCSTQSERFGPWGIPSPNSNWQTSQNNQSADYTGSIKPRGSVSSQALPPVSGTLPPPQNYSARPSFAPPTPTSPYVSTRTMPTVAPGGSIIVENGDTLYGIARRHNVSATSLMAANNLSDANALKVGQRIHIPGASSVAMAQPTYTPVQQPQMVQKIVKPVQVSQNTQAGVHTINQGDTLSSISRRYNVAPGDVARANNLQASDTLRIGQRLTIPSAGTSFAAASPALAKADPITTGSVIKPVPVATPVVSAPVKQQLPQPQTHIAPVKAEAAQPQKVASLDDSNLPQPEQMTSNEFRWPVRGRIVSSYGPQSGGGKNDGINIAVPAGTPIKAAENGVVAYAGSELKGYGNLILVRHDNDFVTAYAHNSEILVRRGDKITRGQVIGRAGQSGNVSQPQLHFEIRKGSTPVDPMIHLSGG